MAAFTSGHDLEALRAAVAAFAQARDWERFHTPRNLLLALASEVGEACDLVRWLGEGEAVPPPGKAQAWADELADCLIFLLRLADVSGVDLPEALLAKLATADQRYPVERSRGRRAKYNELEADDS